MYRDEQRLPLTIFGSPNTFYKAITGGSYLFNLVANAASGMINFLSEVEPPEHHQPPENEEMFSLCMYTIEFILGPDS